MDQLDTLYVGYNGSCSSLVISNGGAVYDTAGYIDLYTGGSSNSVLVTGSGSVWNNSSTLYVGQSGATNLLMITNGGMVVSSNLYVGLNSASSNNIVTLSGGNLIVTNVPGSAVLEVRSGSIALNSGTNIVNQFLATNGGNSVITYNAQSAMVTNTTTTITNGAVLTIGLGTNCHAWAVSGNLALGCTLNITDVGGFTYATYPLFTYGGTLTYGGVTLGVTPPLGYQFAISTNTAGQVDLVVLPAPRRSWLMDPLWLSGL